MIPMIHDVFCIYQPVCNENCLVVLDEFYFKFSLLSSFCVVVESLMSLSEKVDSNSKSATKTSTWINVQVFCMTSDMNFCVRVFSMTRFATSVESIYVVGTRSCELSLGWAHQSMSFIGGYWGALELVKTDYWLLTWEHVPCFEGTF